MTLGLADAAYWISPKPIDAGLILSNALGAESHLGMQGGFELLKQHDFSPVLSVLSSLGITVGLLGLAAYEFQAADY